MDCLISSGVNGVNQITKCTRNLDQNEILQVVVGPRIGAVKGVLQRESEMLLITNDDDDTDEDDSNDTDDDK